MEERRVGTIQARPARCSPLRRPSCCCPPPPSLTTCPPTPSPRWPATTTSKWTKPSLGARQPHRPPCRRSGHGPLRQRWSSPALIVGEQTSALCTQRGRSWASPGIRTSSTPRCCWRPASAWSPLPTGSSRPTGRGGLDTDKIAEVVRTGGIDRLHATIRAARQEPLRDDIAVVELRRLPSTQPSAPTNLSLSEDRSRE